MISRDHPLSIALDNLKHSTDPQEMQERADLERIVNGGERDPRLLPIQFQAALWQDAARYLLAELRDQHPCPSDHGKGSCTCDGFDRAMDELEQASPWYTIFKDHYLMADFRYLIGLAGKVSTDV